MQQPLSPNTDSFRTADLHTSSLERCVIAQAAWNGIRHALYLVCQQAANKADSCMSQCLCAWRYIPPCHQGSSFCIASCSCDLPADPAGWVSCSTHSHPHCAARSDSSKLPSQATGDVHVKRGERNRKRKWYPAHDRRLTRTFTEKMLGWHRISVLPHPDILILPFPLPVAGRRLAN